MNGQKKDISYLIKKIDSFKEHKAYSSWLRQYADDAIKWNEMSGYLMIKAEDFIKRIEKMPLEYIRDWLDGKNRLEITYKDGLVFMLEKEN